VEREHVAFHGRIRRDGAPFLNRHRKIARNQRLFVRRERRAGAAMRAGRCTAARAGIAWMRVASTSTVHRAV
jgi:hypothetical protein